MALFVFPAPSLPPRRTNSPRGCVSRPRPWPSSGHSLASASPPAQVLQEAEGAGGLRGLPGARGHKDHRAGEVAGNGLGPRWAVKAQSLGSDGRTWLEWRFLCFGRGQRVGTTERIDRRTPSETPSSLDLECHVSHMYKPSDTPPPVGMLSTSPLAGLFARQRDHVPGAALSVVPSRTTSLPAVSTCIVPWSLALPIIGSPMSPPWRPRRLTSQLLGSLVLSEPPPLNACSVPQHRNAPRLHRFTLSAVEMRLGVISQAWPILPNPLRFYFNPTHYS